MGPYFKEELLSNLAERPSPPRFTSAPPNQSSADTDTPMEEDTPDPNDERSVNTSSAMDTSPPQPRTPLEPPKIKGAPKWFALGNFSLFEFILQMFSFFFWTSNENQEKPSNSIRKQTWFSWRTNGIQSFIG
jgi:hypothetical protein